MAISRLQKAVLLLSAIISGILCATYVSFNDKDVTGWIIGAFVAFGGLLLAVMTLAGHSLTLIQDNDWRSLQQYRDTYSIRIKFSTLLSFLLLITVFVLIMSYTFNNKYLQCASRFLFGMSFVYILFLPFYLSKMYLDYYDYIIKKQKEGIQKK